MPGTDPTTDPQVRAAMRLLHVIEALNRRAVSSLDDVAEASALPKSTTARLLATLVTGGYAVLLPLRRGYALGPRIVRLSSGYREADLVVANAMPILAAFTARHLWPIGIGTLDYDAMRVRYSTHRHSPYSADEKDWTDRRAPLLSSAIGLAYLAFCPEDERRAVLSLLRSSERKLDRIARDTAGVEAALAATRRRGYAVTAPIGGARVTGMAVPVMREGRVLASLSLRFFNKVLNESQVSERYLAAVQMAANDIAAALTLVSGSLAGEI